MGGIFGSNSAKPPRLNNVVIQQSAYGVPISTGWGTNRVQANLIWYNAFKAAAQKQSSGKGGGSVTTGYNYSASVIMAVGEGTITGIRTVYKDQNVYTNGSKTALQQAGLSLMTGAAGQAVWGYLTTNYSSQAIGYSRTAYVYASNYALSTSATLQNHSFEVQWPTRAVVSGTTIDDALPSDIVTDFLTNPISGVPLWGSGLLASMTAYANYCTAAGLFLSPNLTAARTAADFLTEILDASNSDAVWSGGQLKIVPYGDTAITNNGVTYTPNLTPVYALTEDDFIPQSDGDDPVKIALGKLADAFNSVQIGFLDRTLNYNENTSIASDAASVANYGARREDTHTLNSICDPGVAAAVAQLRVQRLSNLRRTFTFSLDWRYCLLEEMDLVTLTSGDLNALLVRITEIKESADGGLDITAEEMLVGTSHAPAYGRQASAGTIINTSIAPGSVSTPVLINPPRTLTNGDTQAWIAVSGGVNWGGCQVFTSADGVNYQYQGTINAPARYGALTSALSAVADPDTTSSFGVDLTASLGTLNTATAADANAASTLCLVDSELISYQAATLTSANHYTLGTLLRRGLMGTTPAAHSTSAPFVRLDGGIFKYPYTSAQNGKTIHVKFCSFNVYGQSLEDISTVTDYTVTLSPSSATITSAWTNLTGVPGNLTALNGSETIQNSLLPSGTGNRVVLSQFEKGTIGWGTNTNGSSSTLANTGTNPQGLNVQGVATAASQWFNGYESNWFGVTAGEQLACSALISTAANTTGNWVISYRNASGGNLGSDVRIGSLVAANTSTGTLCQAMVTVPATAVAALVYVQGISVAAGSISATMQQPMVQGVPAGQTTYPTFTPGPISTPGADVTSANTALYLNGQSAWATYSGLSPSNVAAPGNNLVYDGGFTLQGQGWAASGFTYQTFADIGPGFDSSISSAYMISPQFTAYAGAYYTAQLWVSSNSTASGTLPYIYIQWYTSGGGLNGNTPVAPVSNTGYALAISTGAAPAGTAYGKFVLCTSTLSSGAYVWFCKAKVEQGSAATPFNDAATFGALYQSGATIDSLKPAQVNSDQTSLNTALYLNNASPLAQGNSLTTGQVTNTNITVSSGTISGIGTGAGTYIDNAYVSQTTNTFQATQTFQGSQTALAAYLYNAGELVYLNGSTGWGSTATVILSYGSVLFMTSQTNANFVVNVEMGPSGQTVNAAMGVGEAVTIAVLVVNGATAYYCTGLHIDGTNYTVNWAGGSAPSAGFANGIDCYMFTIIKVSTTPTYTILGSLTQY